MSDSRTHHLVIASIVEHGSAPDVVNLARKLGVTEDEARSSLDRLSEGHGLVLHPGTHEIWAAHPFSLVPTATWVENERRGWWAPCVWCGLGLAELVGPKARIHTRVGGEAETLVLERDENGVSPSGLFVHFPVTVARAWDNVHRFCGCVQVFRGEDEATAWCERHGIASGDLRPLDQVDRLARRWYGGYLAEDWVKWTVDEARDIFREIGLDGPTWDLPVTPGTF